MKLEEFVDNEFFRRGVQTNLPSNKVVHEGVIVNLERFNYPRTILLDAFSFVDCCVLCCCCCDDRFLCDFCEHLVLCFLLPHGFSDEYP